MAETRVRSSPTRLEIAAEAVPASLPLLVPRVLLRPRRPPPKAVADRPGRLRDRPSPSVLPRPSPTAAAEFALQQQRPTPASPSSRLAAGVDRSGELRPRPPTGARRAERAAQTALRLKVMARVSFRLGPRLRLDTYTGPAVGQVLAAARHDRRAVPASPRRPLPRLL